ncbi:hypothetical protein CFU_3999 [Collimonas fungivorans Ter331]|uniref:Uncharacterized protein n=1 Tax=Collimonas fungivorans (strain Ter331) TaxID=1005048 RepID=G0AF95_COLFT|nr:hypothetical protein CFU_3999 [Collimonas fungivorans Ter331]
MISPRLTENETSSTALTRPARMANWVCRLLTVSVVSISSLLRLQAWIEDIAQLVRHQVDGHHGNQQGDAGKHADPVFAGQQVLKAIGDQQTKRGFGDRQSEAEERQGRFQGNRRRHLQGGHHDQRRQAVRQQMAEHDAQRRQAERGGSFNVFLLAFHQRRTARGARVIGPLHRHQSNDDLVDAAPGQGQQDQGDQDGRERQLDIRDSHDEGFDAAACVAGKQPQRQAQRQRDDSADDADHHRNAYTVQYRRQHVAALVVGAEQVGHAAVDRCLARLQARIHHIQLGQVVGILGRDNGREYRRQHDQHQQHEPRGGNPAAKKIADKTLPGRFHRIGHWCQFHLSLCFLPGAHADRAKNTACPPPG